MSDARMPVINSEKNLTGVGRAAVQEVFTANLPSLRSELDQRIEERAARIEVRQPDFGFVNGKRYYSPITYTWPDYYNGDNSQWSKFLKFGNSLGIVILNRASGEWLVKRPDTDFATQANLAMAAGAKRIAFYIKTRYGANAPEGNPYDKAPSAFVETKVRSWTNGILPLENRLAAVEAALKKLQAKEA